MAPIKLLDETYIPIYKELKEDGLPDSEIAKIFYTSQRTLDRWKVKYEISFKRTPEEYIKLREAGYPDKLIAARWKMSENGLYLWKRRVKIDRKYFIHRRKA